MMRHFVVSILPFLAIFLSLHLQRKTTPTVSSEWLTPFPNASKKRRSLRLALDGTEIIVAVGDH